MNPQIGKKYIDSRGWKYQVMSGIGENTFEARYQRPEKHGDVGWKGLTSVPWRKTFDEAQADLDQLAEKKGWKEWTESKFIGGPGDGTIELIQPPHNNDMALKPCPFCGSKSIWYEKYLYVTGPRWRCWCADCLAGIDPGWAQQKIDVRDLWNRRAVQPNPPLTLEQLRNMDGEPVFISHLKDGYGDWALVDLKYEVCRTAKGGPAIFETYGRTWTAYRRKLEGQL